MKRFYKLLLFAVFALMNAVHAFSIKSIDTKMTIIKVRVATQGNSTFVVGSSYEGTLIAVDYSGNTLWVNKLSGYQNQDLWCGDINNDGNDEILASNSDGYVYCVDSNGGLLWKWAANSAGMMSACNIKSGNTNYVVCGGFDKSIYFLDATGKLLKEIKSSTYSDMNPWGDGDLPPNKVHTTNYLRPVKRSGKADAVALHATNNHMQTLGKIYLFEALASAPYRTSTFKLGSSKCVGDLRSVDPDGDGNSELLVGASAFRFDMAATRYNPQDGSYKEHIVPTLDFGYRVMQTEYIGNGSNYQYVFKFGNQMYVVGSDFSTKTELVGKYSFWDMTVDHRTNKLILASSESGGSCIHVFDANTSAWQNEYKNLTPPGNISTIISNVNSYKNSMKSFVKPSWERETLPVYFMSDQTNSGEAKTVSDYIRANFKSPVFLGNSWGAHCENYNRNGEPNNEYANRRDGRMSYDWSQTQCTNFFKGVFNDDGAAYWGGHGNDPYMYSLDTHKKMLDFNASQNKHLVLIYPELEDHSNNFAQVMGHLVNPLAAYAEQKNGKVFVRCKNIFWLSASYLPMWDDLSSGKYANAFVPSMEETTDKTMDLSLAGRMGLWAAGSVDSWGGRSVPDNTSMNRSRQFCHQMMPNHALRQMVYAIASGAQYLDNHPNYTEYLTFVWELIARGALYVPKREEIVSFSPVHLSMKEPDPDFITEGTKVKWTTFYDQAYEDGTPRVFSRMQGNWPNAPVTEWDFSRYAANVKDRGYHFIPPYNNGMVLITPPQDGKFANTSVPRGRLTDHLHPIYKNIMTEYITDGKNYYSKDGNSTYSADQYYTTIENDIKQKAQLLPITVEGNVGWVAAQTGPKHFRLTLVDAGYLNPSDKTAIVRFNGINVLGVKDVVDGKTFAVSANKATVDVKCGLFRFIDIEIATVYPSGTPVDTNPLVSFSSPLNNQEYPKGSSVNVKVNASDDGSISNVKLFINNVLVGQDVNAPYEWGATDAALKNMAAGSYTLKAVATDNAGHTSETSIGIKVVEGNINGKTVILTPIHDAFIQGAVGTNSNDLKVESGNRVSYLMFDLSAISGSIETAELSITVGADNGNGEFVVYLGNGTNWTETTLSSSNAPAQGVALASLNGTFEKGLTYQWPLNVASLTSGSKLSLIVKQVSGGSDVWFSSKESGSAPQLKITSSGVATNLSNWSSSVVQVFPNPIDNFVHLDASQQLKQIAIYTMDGTLLTRNDVNSKTASVYTGMFQSGSYVLMIQTEDGHWSSHKLIKL